MICVGRDGGEGKNKVTSERVNKRRIDSSIVVLLLYTNIHGIWSSIQQMYL